MGHEELSSDYGQFMFSLLQFLNQQEPPEIYFGSLSDDKNGLTKINQERIFYLYLFTTISEKEQ